MNIVLLGKQRVFIYCEQGDLHQKCHSLLEALILRRTLCGITISHWSLRWNWSARSDENFIHNLLVSTLSISLAVSPLQKTAPRWTCNFPIRESFCLNPHSIADFRPRDTCPRWFQILRTSRRTPLPWMKSIHFLCTWLHNWLCCFHCSI